MSKASRRGLLRNVVIGVVVATVVGLAAIYPYGGVPEPDQQGFAAGTEVRFNAEILEVRELPEQSDFVLPGSREVSVDVELENGGVLTIDAVDEGGLFEAGRTVQVAQVSAEGTDPQFAIVDFPRGMPLTWLAAVFAAAVIALGRWQGLRALVGLGVSGLLIIVVAIPALLAGQSPTVVALVIAVAVMLATLPLSHGWSVTTQAAMVGTSIALLATVGLALVAVEATSLTGLSSEDVQLLRFAVGTEIDIRGLLLAGIIIGTLGVLDDVTVSQASTVAALRRANPEITDRAVFGEALRVGRDHIAATVNTLFLAYAGAALPLLILFTVGDGAIGETITSELVAQEIVRTIVGSLGLIMAVPLTTAVAAATIDPESAEVAAHSHGQERPEPSSGTAAEGSDTDAASPSASARGGPSASVVSAARPTDPTQPTPAPGEVQREEPVDEQEWTNSLRQAYGLPDTSSDGNIRSDP
ncbi:YibE/F family protein [Euzebya tangerina]|uniref:YibE/F family protein n=1 Tax=Euzebya tangerina TaxID=591198 RepID=UPI000E312007|nr:YibE/F family protein [Euzebya tangerina]